MSVLKTPLDRDRLQERIKWSEHLQHQERLKVHSNALDMKRLADAMERAGYRVTHNNRHEIDGDRPVIFIQTVIEWRTMYGFDFIPSEQVHLLFESEDQRNSFLDLFEPIVMRYLDSVKVEDENWPAAYFHPGELEDVIKTLDAVQAK